MYSIRKIKGTQREQIPYNIKYMLYPTPDVQDFNFVKQDNMLSDVYIINPVGFTSTPDENDNAYIFQGSFGDKCCICVDTFYKPDTVPNEVCVGNFKTENYIRINDNQIKIENAGTQEIISKSNKTSINANSIIDLISADTVRIKALNILIEGDVTVSGNMSITGTLNVNGMITADQGMTVNGKVINDSHTHSGVTGGSGTTGGVV